MKILITGATGYIGGSVAAELIARGHQVSGLVRSADGATAVTRFGIEPVRGTLDDRDVLTTAAQAAEMVIDTASADHRASTEAMLQALAGSGKTYIRTSGSSIVGSRAAGELREDVFAEDTPFNPSPGRAGPGHAGSLGPGCRRSKPALDRHLSKLDLWTWPRRASTQHPGAIADFGGQEIRHRPPYWPRR